MSILLRISAICLALTISACSSGSSDDAIGQNNSTDETLATNSNTTTPGEAPQPDQPVDDDALASNVAEGLVIDEAQEIDDEQEAAANEPSGDNAGEDTVADADNSMLSIIDAETADNMLAEEQSTSAADDLADELAEDVTDTEQDADEAIFEGDTASVDSGELAEEVEDTTSDTPIGQLTLRIRTLNARALMALNQSLSQGELFSVQQQRCLGGFDPAVGEPLLAINCERALATGTIPIYSSVASLKDTEQCRSSIQDTSVAPSDVNCTVNQADITVSTLWTIPDVPDAARERPQPTFGSQISYNIETNVLRLEDLDDGFDSSYICDYDLASETLISSIGASDCNSVINGAIDLIDTYLDSESHLDNET